MHNSRNMHFSEISSIFTYFYKWEKLLLLYQTGILNAEAQYYTTRHLWRIQAKYHRMYAYGLCIERTCICKQFPSISSLRLVNCSTLDWQAWNYGFLSMNLWKRPSGCWSRLQSGIPARTAAIFWLRCIPNFPLGVHCLTWTNMSWSCQ